MFNSEYETYKNLYSNFAQPITNILPMTQSSEQTNQRESDLKIRLFIAGNFVTNPFYKSTNWREEVYKKLDEYIEFEIVNVDPTKTSILEDEPLGVFGQDCYLIKSSDIVIAYLTDDVSVGSSQEMLIAKFYGKPLLGIAQDGGKFNNSKKELLGKIYNNWKHPFVAATCDAIVNSVEEAAKFIIEYFSTPQPKPKDINILNESIEYFLSLKKDENNQKS